MTTPSSTTASARTRRAAAPAAGPAGTFRDAYEVLQRHAETLRQQSEPNIDDLLTIVNESVNAYKVCKARIDAVEKALEEALSAAQDDVPTPSAGAAPARPSAVAETDNEIPF